jgi:hypothetical protein
MRILTAAIVLLATSSALGQEIEDESTGRRFKVTESAGGTSYRCLGAGVRKVFIVKAYALTYCLEAVKADAVVKGFVEKVYPGMKGEDLQDKLEDDQRFFDALASAPADKLVIMKVVRDIGREKIAGAFRDALSKVLPGKKVETLVATIPGDLKDGQTAHIYSIGDKLVLDFGGTAREIEDAEIVKNLWRVWLGPDGVSPSLKESIAARAAGK